MNHIFRVIFNHSLQCWQAVAEIGRRQHKTRSEKSATTTLSTPRLFKLLPLSAFVALSLQNAFAAPQGGQVSAGQATITQQGKVTDIHQSSQNAAINWQKFDVAPKETVNFHQPNKDAITLNRVTGKEESVIQGAINAKGNVFISNPNGVLIGNNAQINVGSLVATTQAIKDEDLMNGKLKFDGQAGGKVENNANINVPKGGVIALIAPIVKNNGKLTAFEGNVLLASAEKFSITLPKDNFSYTLDRGTLQGLVDNKGAILADGGRVVLTAKGINAVKKSVIKHSGVIEANTVRQQNGVIELLGDLDHSELQLSGTIKAEGKGKAPGGKVETSAAKLKISDKAKVSTKSEKGKTGKWTLDPKDFVVAKEGGDITGKQVSQFLASNDMELKSREGKVQEGKGDVIINDEIAWDKNTLTLNAENDIKINQPLNGLGEAKLALKYGQGSSDGGSADYYVNAQVNLPAGKNFSIQKGENGERKAFTVYHQMPEVVKTEYGYDFGLFTEKYIAFGKDIDLSYTKDYVDFSGWGIEASDFHVDGLGHILDKFTINETSSVADNSGLFMTGIDADPNPHSFIRNIGVTNINITSKASYVGGLIGKGHNIFNSYVSGNMTLTYEDIRAVGGLVGYGRNITNSYANVNITVSSPRFYGYGLRMGGLVGNGYNITNSYSTGNLAITPQDYGSDLSLGGLVGLGGNITNSYSTVNVTASGNEINAGGLVGELTSNIINSYAKGDIVISGSNSFAGGLVGRSRSDAFVSNSYANGNVTAYSENRQFIGGLIGNSMGVYSKLINSYATGNVILKGGSYSRGGRLLPSGSNLAINSYATGEIDIDLNWGWNYVEDDPDSMKGMKEKISEIWDFENTWAFVEGSDDPVLKTTQINAQNGWDPETWTMPEGAEHPVLRAFQTKATALPEQPDPAVTLAKNLTTKAEVVYKKWSKEIQADPSLASEKNPVILSTKAEALNAVNALPDSALKTELLQKLAVIGEVIPEVKPDTNIDEISSQEQLEKRFEEAGQLTQKAKNLYEIAAKQVASNPSLASDKNKVISEAKNAALAVVNSLPASQDKEKYLATLAAITLFEVKQPEPTKQEEPPKQEEPKQEIKPVEETKPTENVNTVNYVARANDLLDEAQRKLTSAQNGIKNGEMNANRLAATKASIERNLDDAADYISNISDQKVKRELLNKRIDLINAKNNLMLGASKVEEPKQEIKPTVEEKPVVKPEKDVSKQEKVEIQPKTSETDKQQQIQKEEEKIEKNYARGSDSQLNRVELVKPEKIEISELTRKEIKHIENVLYDIRASNRDATAAINAMERGFLPADYLLSGIDGLSNQMKRTSNIILERVMGFMSDGTSLVMARLPTNQEQKHWKLSDTEKDMLSNIDIQQVGGEYFMKIEGDDDSIASKASVLAFTGDKSMSGLLSGIDSALSTLDTGKNIIKHLNVAANIKNAASNIYEQLKYDMDYVKVFNNLNKIVDNAMSLFTQEKPKTFTEFHVKKVLGGWEMYNDKEIPPIVKDFIATSVKKLVGLDSEKAVEEMKNISNTVEVALITHKQQQQQDVLRNFLKNKNVSIQDKLKYLAQQAILAHPSNEYTDISGKEIFVINENKGFWSTTYSLEREIVK